MRLNIAYFVENNKKNNKKVTVHMWVTVYLPTYTVYVPWTVQEPLVLKKKKKKAKNADAFDVNANQMDTKTQMYVICFISW